jgi:hypothetical protein
MEERGKGGEGGFRGDARGKERGIRLGSVAAPHPHEPL